MNTRPNVWCQLFNYDFEYLKEFIFWTRCPVRSIWTKTFMMEIFRNNTILFNALEVLIFPCMLVFPPNHFGYWHGLWSTIFSINLMKIYYEIKKCISQSIFWGKQSYLWFSSARSKICEGINTQNFWRLTLSLSTTIILWGRRNHLTRHGSWSWVGAMQLSTKVFGSSSKKGNLVGTVNSMSFKINSI
jgi:hypothetical protein